MIIRLTENDLHRIIKDTVNNILLKEGMEDMGNPNAIFTTINGVPMTKKQFEKYKKEQKKKADAATKPKKQKSVTLKTGNEVSTE